MERKAVKVIVAIQAKTGSQRLPNKLLRKIDGKATIEHLIEKVKLSKEADAVVLATTDRPEDDVLEQIAEVHGVAVYRGAVEDTLDRLYGAAKAFHADAILRITGDNIIVDVALVDAMIREYKKRASKIKFLTTCLPPTFPEGFSMEIISTKALEVIHKTLTAIEDRGSFMIYVSNHPKKFPRYTLRYKKDVSNIRLTMDYPDDLKLLRKVFQHFKKQNVKNFGVDAVVDFLEKNPKLIAINQYLQDRNKYPFAFGAEAIKKAM